jgi:hypothetical protein
MHRMASPLTRLVLLVWGLTAVGCADPCDSDGVRSRLAASAEGDTIDVAGCMDLSGDFTVPAARTLAGPAHIDGSVTLVTEADAVTALTDVSITSHHIAVTTTGEGTARIGGGTIAVVTGVGLSLAAAGAEIEGVTLAGNVTEENRDQSRWLSVTSSTEATHGIVIGRGGVRITDASITGFAWVAVSAGADLIPASGGPIDLRIVDSQIGGGLGVGISSSAEVLTLMNVQVRDIWTGVRGWPSYGVLLIDGEASTAGLSVTDADGFGLVEIAGTSSHGDLVIEHTGDVGAWFGTGVEVGMIGSGTRIADTGFAGILAVDAAGLAMLDGTISGVRAERRTVGVSGAISVGDGIDAIGTPLNLRSVRIEGAERIGLLVDASMSNSFTSVIVASTGDAFGAAQGTIDRGAEDFTSTPVAGWDSGLTRAGTAAINDAALSERLSIAIASAPPSTGSALGVIAPMY